MYGVVIAAVAIWAVMMGNQYDKNINKMLNTDYTKCSVCEPCQKDGKKTTCCLPCEKPSKGKKQNGK